MAVQDPGEDDGGRGVGVTEKLLHGPEAKDVLEQMRREGVMKLW